MTRRAFAASILASSVGTLWVAAASAKSPDPLPSYEEICESELYHRNGETIFPAYDFQKQCYTGESIVYQILPGRKRIRAFLLRVNDPAVGRHVEVIRAYPPFLLT